MFIHGSVVNKSIAVFSFVNEPVLEGFQGIALAKKLKLFYVKGGFYAKIVCYMDSWLYRGFIAESYCTFFVTLFYFCITLVLFKEDGINIKHS